MAPTQVKLRQRSGLDAIQTQEQGWLDSLPQETKAQLAALCRHYGPELKTDLPEIIAAYYHAKTKKG